MAPWQREFEELFTESRARARAPEAGSLQAYWLKSWFNHLIFVGGTVGPLLQRFRGHPALLAELRARFDECLAAFATAKAEARRRGLRLRELHWSRPAVATRRGGDPVPSIPTSKRERRNSFPWQAPTGSGTLAEWPAVG